MNHVDILDLARETAGRLGIRMIDPALVLKNMKPKIGITTILRSEDYIMWIDKHYIAYGESFKPEVVYVFTDEEHVSEELRSVIHMIQQEKSAYNLKTLLSIKKQLQQAAKAKPDDGLYFFTQSKQKKTECEAMKFKKDIRTLCYKCKTDYMNTGDYYIRRTDYEQTDKKPCTFCSARYGYDYVLSPRIRKGGRR